MKIGIDARMYGVEQTGIGVYIKHIVEGVVKFDQKNQYFIFMMPSAAKTWLPPRPGVEAVAVPAHWYSWQEQLVFPLTLWKEKLDLTHFTHFNSPVLYRRPQVLTIHDVTPKFFPGHKMNSPLRRAAFNLVYRQSLFKAKRIIAVSQSTKKDLMTYFKVPEPKITVIYEGVNEQYLQPVSAEAITAIKNKYQITKPYFFYVGVWRNHKNVVGLIKAFAQLRQQHQLDYQLVLGGKEDPYYPEVRKTWQQLNLDQVVIRPGFIPAAEMPAFYAGAQALVIPSFYEGFGLHGLEAMACGTPVVASDTSSLPEIFGPAALYFSPHQTAELVDQLWSLVKQPDLRPKLILLGQEQIKKYSWSECLAQTLHTYQEVMVEEV